EESFAYRLMDLKTRKVNTSRDVEYFEKKEFETPPNSPNVNSIPIVKKEENVPIDDEIDDRMM
ncbi:hypothetical protein KI387_012778, partial [Taxus chinensis]